MNQILMEFGPVFAMVTIVLLFFLPMFSGMGPLARNKVTSFIVGVTALLASVGWGMDIGMGYRSWSGYGCALFAFIATFAFYRAAWPKVRKPHGETDSLLAAEMSQYQRNKAHRYH